MCKLKITYSLETVAPFQKIQITSVMAETHALTAKPYCCFKVLGNWSDRKCKVLWPRYLKLDTYPKYGDFTRLATVITSNLAKFT